LEPLSYIQTKEIMESHTKYYNVFQINTFTTFVIIIISIFLYLWYEFKSIPRKLIVKYVKPKEETPKSTEILNDLPNQINIEENVMAKLNRWGSDISIAPHTRMYMSTHPHKHAHITQSPSRYPLRNKNTNFIVNKPMENYRTISKTEENYHETQNHSLG